MQVGELVKKLRQSACPWIDHADRRPSHPIAVHAGQDVRCTIITARDLLRLPALEDRMHWPLSTG